MGWSEWGLFALVGSASLGYLWWASRRYGVAAKGRVVMMAMGVALLALGWLALRPRQAVLDEAIILTSGSSLAQLRTVSSQLPKGTPVFALPGSPQIATISHNLTQAPGVAWLRRQYVNTGTWHVLGWGLENDALSVLAPAELVFYPSDLPLGFQWTDWSQVLALGGEMTFRGRLNRPLGEGWLAQLQAPSGETVAEVALKADQINVQLRNRPSLAGPLTYGLVLVDPNGQVQLREEIPVYVEAHQQLQVWVLLGSPRFEIKFLKHWLGERGSQMWIRTRFTNTDWRDEMVNREPFANKSGSWPWQDTDVVLADMAAIKALTATQRRGLREAIGLGLGLFLFPETVTGEPLQLNSSDSTFFSNWQLKWQEEGIEQLQAQLNWQGQYPLPARKIDILPAEIQLQPGQRPLMDDGFGAVIAAAAQRGKGMVATSLVKHSHRWALQGETADFRGYWSQLLSQIARPQTPPPQLHVKQPAFVAKQTDWTVWAPESEAMTIGTPHSAVYWATDGRDWGRKSGRFWPEGAGWQEAVYGEISLNPFYVFPNSAWETSRANQRIHATRAYIEAQGQTSSKRGLAKAVPVLGLLGLLVILLSAGLWLGEKLQRL